MSEMASNYYTYRRYDCAAKTWAKLIDPAKENNLADYMQVGRAYYNGEKYKSADSVFSVVIKKSPDYLPAYMYTAHVPIPEWILIQNSDLPNQNLKSCLSVAAKDSVKNESEMMEALTYLGYLQYGKWQLYKSKGIL